MHVILLNKDYRFRTANKSIPLLDMNGFFRPLDINLVAFHKEVRRDREIGRMIDDVIQNMRKQGEEEISAALNKLVERSDLAADLNAARLDLSGIAGWYLSQKTTEGKQLDINETRILNQAIIRKICPLGTAGALNAHVEGLIRRGLKPSTLQIIPAGKTESIGVYRCGILTVNAIEGIEKDDLELVRDIERSFCVYAAEHNKILAEMHCITDDLIVRVFYKTNFAATKDLRARMQSAIKISDERQEYFSDSNNHSISDYRRKTLPGKIVAAARMQMEKSRSLWGKYKYLFAALFHECSDGQYMNIDIVNTRQEMRDLGDFLVLYKRFKEEIETDLRGGYRSNAGRPGRKDEEVKKREELFKRYYEAAKRVKNDGTLIEDDVKAIAGLNGISEEALVRYYDDPRQKPSAWAKEQASKQQIEK